MSDTLDELRKTEKPKNDKHTGYVWVSMLIRYNTDGSATVMNSFARPAQDSKIQGLIRPKKSDKFKKKAEVIVETEFNNEEDLF